MYKYCCQIHSYSVKCDLDDHLVDIKSENILNTTTLKMSDSVQKKMPFYHIVIHVCCALHLKSYHTNYHPTCKGNLQANANG